MFWKNKWDAGLVAKFISGYPKLELLSLCHASIRGAANVYKAIGDAPRLRTVDLNVIEAELLHSDWLQLYDMNKLMLRYRTNDRASTLGQPTKLPREGEAKDRVLGVDSMQQFWTKNTNVEQVLLDLWPSPFDVWDLEKAWVLPSDVKEKSKVVDLHITLATRGPPTLTGIARLLDGHPQLATLVIQSGIVDDPEVSFATRAERKRFDAGYRERAAHVQVDAHDGSRS